VPGGPGELVLLPVTGNSRLGNLQLLSQLAHLPGERGVGALGCRHLGLHLNVPIAINMRIYDGGGALARQSPVRNSDRHRASIGLDDQITRVCPDRRVYLRLRWWIGVNSRIGVTGQCIRDELFAGAILRLACRSPYVAPYLAKT